MLHKLDRSVQRYRFFYNYQNIYKKLLAFINQTQLAWQELLFRSKIKSIPYIYNNRLFLRAF
ncbi:MAG: hypothetical protein COA57_04110 [Flavobacteriales bacterium]|nr:MAG: hypothetical protein COA57_04110 [Flavobacteriales bacterium]